MSDIHISNKKAYDDKLNAMSAYIEINIKTLAKTLVVSKESQSAIRSSIAKDLYDMIEARNTDQNIND